MAVNIHVYVQVDKIILYYMYHCSASEFDVINLCDLFYKKY